MARARKSGSARKRSKKRQNQPVVEPEATPRAITPNGQFILTAMKEHKSPGTWRDYVLFVGDQMLDAWGSYNIVRVDEDGKSVASSTVALLHKKHLHVAIGEGPAARFWWKKLGRRSNYGSKHFHQGRQVRGRKKV